MLIRNEKFMAIVLRFLKETRLFPLWVEYVNSNLDKYKNCHWSDKLCVDYILGATSFTSFIVKKLKEKDNIDYSEGVFIYYRFVYWLKKLGLIDKYHISQATLLLTDKLSEDEMKEHIIIDPITKKTKLLFHKKKN